ncbi:MAG: carboxypeptidase-like regulatory domain-containing protein [Bacteroidota bacterium]
MFKSIYRSIFILCFLFVTAASFATGNEERKVTAVQGRVVDGSNFEGIAGAIVEVEGTNIKVYTDFEGNFTLPALAEGTYTLKSTLVSYNEVKLRNIKISAQGTSAIEMRLHTN